MGIVLERLEFEGSDGCLYGELADVGGSIRVISTYSESFLKLSTLPQKM